jgi:hypothetical protein
LTFILLMVHIPQGAYAQDSIQREKILVVENTNPKGQQIHLPNGASKEVPPRIFKEGKRVTITRYDNNKRLKGRIRDLADSSLTLKGNVIRLSEIKSISAYRGVEPTILGASLLTAGISTAIILNRHFTHDENEDSYGLGGTVAAVMGAFLGGCTAIFGVIQMVTIKQYRMEQDYRLTVKTQERENKPRMMQKPFGIK